MTQQQHVAAADGCKPPLALIPGWGHRASAWQDLVAIAEPWFEVRLLDLPGYDGAAPGVPGPHAEAGIIEALARQLPLQSLLCGWSLGGMLATRLAAQHPERVCALVTLCSNPLFVARDGWPAAMPAATFNGFAQQVSVDAAATLRRFQTMAAMGSRSARRDLRRLKELTAASPVPSNSVLDASLGWLAELDVRGAIATLEQPQLHLLGREDSLVPSAVGSAIAALNPAARVEVLPEVGHLPLISRPELVLNRLQGINTTAANSHVASTG